LNVTCLITMNFCIYIPCAKFHGVQILMFEVMGERNLERNFGELL